MQVVHSRYGQLIVSRNDIYVGRGLLEYGEFSEGEVELFRTLLSRDAVVVDVGANIGAHTLAFARLAKHVYAYEPVPILYCALSGMIALNELKNVTAIHAGAYSREGSMGYPDLATGVQNNFGAGSLEPYNKDRPVRVTRVTHDCTFMKVDVEGMELEVLKGASEMIRRCAPVLYLEADRQEKFEPLMEYLRRNLNYFPYWHTPPLFNPDNYFGKKENIWGEVQSINVLASPVELKGFEQVKEWPNFGHVSFRDQVERMQKHGVGSTEPAGV
jgi:FkbM family methyltransferase